MNKRINKFPNGGLLGGITNTVGTAFTGLLNPSGNSTGIGNALLGIGSIASNIPGVGGLIGAGVGVLGGLTNAAFGSNINKDAVEAFKDLNQQLRNYVSGASTNEELLSDFLGLTNLGTISRREVGSDGWFSDKAKNLTRKLNRERLQANLAAITSLGNTANTVDITNDLLKGYNYSAYGGPINMRYTGVMSPLGNLFKDGGGIYIKPSKRGTFTAAAKKHGKGVQEFARQVLANKENYSPAMVKKANFARNSASWKHSDGGSLMSNGAVWDNGLTYINNGDTHENNVYQGVPIGVDNEGIPNLVEEGEVIWNDYVFSNRINVPKAIRSKYKLRGNKDMTFADAAKKMAKESEERPNDPISKRGLSDSMYKLMLELETIRQDLNNLRLNNRYSHGGSFGRLYAGNDAEPQVLARSKAKRPGYNVGDSLLSYPENPVTEPVNNKGGLTWLRYAPVAGSALGVALNLFSRPDYGTADAILEAANLAGSYKPISFTPIGNRLTYTPMDINYEANRLASLAAATRRNIMNTSGGSSAAAMSGLLAADYNSLLAQAEALRLATLSNIAQRQAVEEFNRQTDMTNTELGLKAAMANQEAALKARNARLSGVAQAMTMRDAVDARRDASMSANMTNFFNSLGDIGREEYSRNMIMSNPALYYSIDSNGNVSYKNGYENLSEAEKKEVRDAANKAKKKKAKKKKAKGGYLTIKKK